MNIYSSIIKNVYKKRTQRFPIKSCLNISYNRSYHIFNKPNRNRTTILYNGYKSNLLFEQKRTIFINVETTPNPDSLKFIFDDPILPHGVFAEFRSLKDTSNSPLARILFNIEGIKYVYFGYDFISINKDESISWNILKPIIQSELNEYISSGDPILKEGTGSSGNDTEILPDDSEVVAAIKELIDTRIRPSVQDDGGDITYKGFIDDVVFIQLHGSCTGCPSSTVTLKNGIERMLMHWIPEVTAVVAVESDEDFQRIAGSNKA